MNVYNLFASRFPSNRSAPCFIIGERTVSYGELEAGAARLGGHLVAQGVEPGDRVAGQVSKTPEAVMLYLAVLKAGGVYLPVNTAYTGHEVRYFLDDAEPRMFVTDAVALSHEARDAPPLPMAVSRNDDDLGQSPRSS